MLISFIKKSQFYFIVSFATLIAIGTLLLKLPILRTGGSLSWIDALFTATSAVCVTGLTTVSLAQFTLGGQMLVMLLIQLGGIGIMTMSGSIIIFMGKNISWSGSKLLANMTENYNQRGTEGMLKTIVIYTILAETLGMFFLFFGFLFHGFTVTDSLWNALFHSISAFCNAGFSPLPNNMVGLSAFIKVVIACLVVFGGLGMYAVYDLLKSTREHSHWKVNTKLIVISSIFLIIAGTLLLKFFQNIDENPIEWVDAFFLSVSARTAGFNSVDMSVLSSSSVMTTIILMLIGGAPGSTAGGMKVTTAALVCVALYNTFAGNQKILLFKREISITNVLRAFTIMIIFVVLASFGTTTFQALSDHISLQSAFFEVSSALATVGLSLGATTQMTVEAKLFIAFYMFLGRVGPLTMFLFLLGREKKSRLSYPQERIIIG